MNTEGSMQSYTHFTLTERESLSKLRAQGLSNGQIAKILGRDKSSIGREIKRNGNKNGTYRELKATILYLRRRKKCRRRRRLESDESLRQYVEEKLKKTWTPEMITARWKVANPAAKLSATTIYAAVKKGRLSADISARTHLRRRAKRKSGTRGKATIKPAHTIHDRPEEAEKRLRLGDIEGDTVSGAIGKGAVLTLVDRKSRFLYATLLKSRDSDLTKAAIKTIIEGKDIKSITLDKGSEFARHQDIEDETNVIIYFADPHSPWQRGTNENTNDILRFFYPKGTDFHEVTETELQDTVTLINNRPKKCLDWLSPLEFLSSTCCT